VAAGIRDDAMLAFIAQSAPASACAREHCFTVLKAADEFAKLTGSLAAFTFAGLIFLVGRAADRRKLEDTTIMFVTGFVSLVVTSFLYGRLAAEELASGRAEALYFSASIVFALAVLQLFLGITRLLMRLGYGPASTFLRGVSVGFMPPVTFVFLMVTAVDTYGFRKTEARAWFHTDLGFEALVAFALLVCLVAWRTWRTLRPTTSLPDHDTRLVRCAWSSVVFLGVITAAAAAASELGSETNFPGFVYMGGLGAAWVAIAVYCCLTSAGGLPAADGEPAEEARAAAIYA
jgi:hypothetical protein